MLRYQCLKVTCFAFSLLSDTVSQLRHFPNCCNYFQSISLHLPWLQNLFTNSKVSFLTSSLMPLPQFIPTVHFVCLYVVTKAFARLKDVKVVLKKSLFLLLSPLNLRESLKVRFDGKEFYYCVTEYMVLFSEHPCVCINFVNYFYTCLLQYI